MNTPAIASVSDVSFRSLTGALAAACVLLFGMPARVAADVVTVNFDSVAVPGSAGADPTTYLASFGISLSGVSPSAPVIYSDQAFYGTGVVAASSGHNFLLQQSAVNGGSFTLNFSTALSSLSFTRIANLTYNSVGTWTATAYSGATAVDSISEPGGLGSFSPATYNLTGENITSLTFSGNGYGYAGISSAMIDDLTLTSAPDSSSTLGLLVLAIGGIAAFRRRRS